MCVCIVGVGPIRCVHGAASVRVDAEHTTRTVPSASHRGRGLITVPCGRHLQSSCCGWHGNKSLFCSQSRSDMSSSLERTFFHIIESS